LLLPRSTATYCSTIGLAAGGHAKWTDTADNNFSANLVFGNDGSQVETHNATEAMVFDGTAVMEGFVTAWTGSRYDTASSE
jgi:hypothetical protein